MKKLTQLLSLLFLVSSLHAQNFEWAAKWGGIYGECNSSIGLDAAGNLYCFMRFSSTIDVDPGPGFLQAPYEAGELLLVKLNPDGGLVWARQMGGPGSDRAAGMTVDADGNCYVTGYFEKTADFDPGPEAFLLTSSGYHDVFVAKYNSDGELVWAKKMGGNDDDEGVVIATDAAGNVYVSGRFQGTADFNPGPATFNMLAQSASSDLFIVKLSALGNYVWSKRFNGGIGGSTLLMDMVLDDAGNLYAIGWFRGAIDFNPDFGIFDMESSPNPENPDFSHIDTYILKLKNNGSFVWAKQMGDSTGGCLGNAIALDPAGDICMVGYHSGNTDFDPNSGVYNLPVDNKGMFFAKLTDNGELRWVKGVASTSSASAEDLDVDEAGNFYITGEMNKGTFDFDPGPGTLNLVSILDHDLFTAKYDANGALVWIFQQQNTEEDLGGSHIAVDQNGGVYCSGFFSGTLNLYTNPDEVTSLYCGGYVDVFVCKFRDASVGVKDAPESHTFKVYPNPGTGIFTLETEQDAACTVRDLMGHVVYKGRGATSIDLSKCANGLYLVTVGNRTEKLLKQE